MQQMRPIVAESESMHVTVSRMRPKLQHLPVVKSRLPSQPKNYFTLTTSDDTSLSSMDGLHFYYLVSSE